MNIDMANHVKKELTLAEARVIAAWSLAGPAQLSPELTKRIQNIHGLIKKLHDDITREQILKIPPG